MNPHAIATLLRTCFRAFGQLLDASPPADVHLQVSALREQYSRLRVWAANLGAHRRDNLSVDHRLREATDVKLMILEILNDLKEALEGIHHS